MDTELGRTNVRIIGTSAGAAASQSYRKGRMNGLQKRVHATLAIQEYTLYPACDTDWPQSLNLPT
jgi:hypothetical protein